MDEAKERLKAWWDHEIIDRPLIGYWAPKLGYKIPEGDKIIDYLYQKNGTNKSLTSSATLKITPIASKITHFTDIFF